jgi:porphobilinogen synthase
MMDGQVGAIRGALDGAGFDDTIILAYAAKYASGLYGPFRDAVGSRSPKVATVAATSRTTATGARRLREARADVEQGADIIMVKPAMTYLDVVPTCAANSTCRCARTTSAASTPW